jgi:predicted phosphodiesterase
MKYAVISDIHGNLEALEKCMEEIDSIKPDRIICLGDLVDYGAQPNECIEIVKKKSDIILLGNHDEAQIDHSLARGFGNLANISSKHTRTIIKKEYLDWFRTLPRYHKENNILFVHSSPCDPEKYLYITCSAEARYNFKYFEEKVCFIGHSHYPGVYEFSNGEVIETEKKQLNSNCRYIINPGSVGQPRDANPKLSYGVFDDEKYIYENIRLDYNVEEAADKIINAGLPEMLGQRLSMGI